MVTVVHALCAQTEEDLAKDAKYRELGIARKAERTKVTCEETARPLASVISSTFALVDPRFPKLGPLIIIILSGASKSTS